LVGFLLLGEKKSGGQYNSEDVKFLTIMANELSVAMQNAQRFAKIQSFNITLKHEIDEATRQLRESNKKLRDLDDAKDDFISMASHQLRTPLTSVKGYISMIMEGDVGTVSEKQKEMLHAAYSSSQRMVYLISDLLNVSRLKTGKFVIDPTEIDMPDMIEDEVKQLVASAASRRVKLHFVKPKKFPKVMLDETKTRQVVMNFIDNAIYYSKGGNKIEIRLTANDKKIEFTVKDQGIGVPKTEQSKLFTKFYRANNAKKARPDGTGLGLFMAKKVIVAQGGAVLFKSNRDKGSTFGFTIPLSRVSPDKFGADKKRKVSDTGD
jgi:signal transduction histidine kinase